MKKIIVMSFCCIAALCSQPKADDEGDRIDALLKEMTLEEKSDLSAKAKSAKIKEITKCTVSIFTISVVSVVALPIILFFSITSLTAAIFSLPNEVAIPITALGTALTGAGIYAARGGI